MRAIWLWGKRLVFVAMMAAAPVAVAMSDVPRSSAPVRVEAALPTVAAKPVNAKADKTPDPGILLMAIIGIGILALTLRSRPAVKRVSA